ncbi:hypothetical protein FT663_04890 [Candidozyma haemuli var. vulneris]|uniref:NAD(P)-binding protein n=1 Tax=Candidozyma haemuli TaxID=45357 RepID=A0A2V1AQ53_9ASCO|nr:hypothetical protein CXQ85_001692 [[Candida] haemuloni]KAF3986406.1 hypothetical protein FT663_04890 [[Candida] haemuloni var. vulneris]KAF3987926.1 hypothetical protein FT662_03697 [[Candida] haemuloni var. vulneris]PVH19915.1 hypothetical protein CXQ85_001692 [[Candida] haemuloni]
MAPRSQFYDPTTATYYNPKEDRRVAIVTGGNSGIGWHTVLQLYLHGFIVYVAGRTESKVLKAIEDIKTEAKKRVEAYNDSERKERFLGTVTYIHFDCCDLASVVSCAEKFAKKENKLHVLINNAGLMAVPYEETKDGYEIQYQVNFVAPFLFTLKLLSNLKAAEVDGLPRVVMLSSEGHRSAVKYYDPSDKIKCTPNFIYTWIRYGVAKTAEIHFAKKLAELHPGILSIAVHPGVIVETELFNHWKNLPLIGWVYKSSSVVIDKTVGVKMEEGCLASLRAALDPSLENENGSYLTTGGVLSKPTKIASEPKYIEKTWEANVEELKKKGFLSESDL